MPNVQGVPFAALDDWFPFLVYALFAAAIPASMLVMSFAFSTRRKDRAPKAQLMPFESGVSTGPPKQQRFTVSFYLTAMLFIVFDIEIVFLYPVAIVLDASGRSHSPSSGSSSGSLPSPTSTCGSGVRSNGGEEEAAGRLRAPVRAHAHAREGAERLREGARRGRDRGSPHAHDRQKAVAWAQGYSIWPDTFGLACCAIEMMSIVSSRYDVARFGAEVFRSSPRQADLLIVSGRVAHKMTAPLREVYDQMLQPKWVIAMGACSSSGGMFNNYAILQGVDKIVAVDVHVPGCPPRPEALLEGIVRLQEKIQLSALHRPATVGSA